MFRTILLKKFIWTIVFFLGATGFSFFTYFRPAFAARFPIKGIGRAQTNRSIRARKTFIYPFENNQQVV